MSRIALAPDADPDAAFAVVRRTLTGRDYLLEPRGPHEAVAHEGGESITARAASHKLRVGARLDADARRIVLEQQSNAAALAGAGAPVFMVWLNIRFSRIVRAVREDLAVAGQR